MEYLVTKLKQVQAQSTAKIKNESWRSICKLLYFKLYCCRKHTLPVQLILTIITT